MGMEDSQVVPSHTSHPCENESEERTYWGLFEGNQTQSTGWQGEVQVNTDTHTMQYVPTKTHGK